MTGALGCATRQSAPPAASASETSAVSLPAQPSQHTETSDSRRLRDLWRQRERDGFGADFLLGPGDILEVSVPLEELEHREVRVSPRDTITLPLAGVVQVRGMTEQGLTDTLRQRLSKYMYDPPVSLFVRHYGSREVAVMGAVAKPGLYTLASGSNTLMDMLGRAGGMTTDSAAAVMFVPGDGAGTELRRFGSLDRSLSLASSSTAGDAPNSVDDTDSTDSSAGHVRGAVPTQPQQVGSVEPVTAQAPSQTGQQSLSESAIARLHPILIIMSDPAMQDDLEMPARPGDMLIIPAAGEVTVSGWVHDPGAFKITPGMTALSAVSAAGGALFSTSAEVLRTASDGERSSIRVNISRVQKGEDADVPVRSGDVVIVDRSAVGAVPYAMYTLLSKFGTGMYLPVP